jgi:hypothetical protein
MAAVKKEETRTIFLRMEQGVTKRISNIPANAKITFGKLQPGSKGDWHNNGGNVLRIYTSGENQLGVFCNVIEFRDESLRVEHKKVVKKVAQSRREEKNGNKTEQATEQVETEWLSEDDVVSGENLPF